jgi:hypothetical protein
MSELFMDSHFFKDYYFVLIRLMICSKQSIWKKKSTKIFLFIFSWEFCAIFSRKENVAMIKLT